MVRRRLRPPLRAALTALAVVAGTLLGSVDALAAPFVGQGTAPIAEGGDRQAARKQATTKARKAALEAAIADMATQGIAIDPGAKTRVIGSAAVWTSAYRILRQGDDGATATVEVEAEIDLPRLEKLLAPASTRPSDPGGPPLAVLAAVRPGQCPAEIAAHVRDHLVARGLCVASGDGPSLTLDLECEALGEVSQARVHGARVTVKASLAGDSPWQGEAVGFAADPAAAYAEALRGALFGVGESLRGGGDRAIHLAIERPWPAAQVRRLEKGIRDSVVGVRSVGVGGIEPDGSVVLRIDASIDAEALAQRLGALRVPGVGFRVVGVGGPKALSVTFAPAPVEVQSTE
ncbi:MAG: hypothetical protein R3B09_30365 [Nannocystaceae bacterium]